MIRVAIVVGKMDSGGKKNLIMEYYRHIDRNKVQFDFICDSDSQAIPKEEIDYTEVDPKIRSVADASKAFLQSAINNERVVR